MRIRAHRPGRIAGTVALASLVLALIACGGDGESAPTTTAAETTAPTETQPETTAPETTTETETEPAPQGPPFRQRKTSGASTGASTGSPSGLALLADVRLTSRPRFDRIVFEFQPGGVPSYEIDYVQPPITTNPGGAPMSVGGEAFLSIRLEPASGFDLEGDESQVYQGPLRLSGEDAGARVVEDVVRTEDFQAVVTWVAGLGRQAPFRAFVLSGPPRLVVDVRSGD